MILKKILNYEVKKCRENCQNTLMCCKPFYYVPEQNYISPVLFEFVIDDNVFATCTFTGINNHCSVLISSHTLS